MDRADAAGLSVATIGHIALFGALSLGIAASIPPKPVPPPALEVEFVDTVALESAAPVAEAMPQAEAPEVGMPEDAAPQPAPVAEPLPPPPQQELAPPPPAPAPAPAPAKAEPVPKPKPEPAPKAKPIATKPAAAKPVAVKPVAAKPDPKLAARAKEQQLKAAQAKAAQEKAARTKAAQAQAAAAAKQTAARNAAAAAAAGKGTKAVAREPRFGKDLLAGLKDPSTGKADKPAAPAISANAMAGIQAAIKRQIQPCANRQVNPGPGASRIQVKLNLKLNKDGSLAAAPRVVATSGVDDENSRYEKRVSDLAIAAYTGCAPMRGLPVDLYRTAKGGWNNVNMNYKLPS